MMPASIRASALAFLLALPAAAAGLFVNGVQADGIRNTAFQNCDVRIDEAGNIHITAKGYSVAAVGAVTPSAAVPAATAPAAPSQGALTRRYFLVGLAGRPGESQWEIDVFVNAKFVRKITDREAQTTIEVTKYMNVGRNTVHVQAARVMPLGPRSSSPQAFVEVVVGEGNHSGGALLVSNPIVRYRKTAAQSGTEVRDWVVVAQ
jgi:hypothetical protein